MRATRPHLRLIVALLLAAGLLVACDDDADAPDDGTFVGLLALVPDTPEHREAVALGDVARSREVLGIERPVVGADGLDAATLFDYLGRFTQTPEPARPSFPGMYGGDFEFGARVHDTLGVSLLDVDQWVWAGPPPRSVSAARGAFDPDAIRAHTETCDACPPLTVEERRGMQLLLWGEDGAMDMTRREQPPLFDRLGRGGNLALADGLVMHSHFGEELRAMVDAAGGDGSLAGVEDFRLAAAGMDELGALSALVSAYTQGPAFVEEVPDHLADAWVLGDDDTLLLPYDTYAIGPGWDGEPYMAIALVHADEAAAEENARRLPDRVAATRFPEPASPDGAATWGEVIDHVEVDGRVVLARLHGHAVPTAGPEPASGWAMLFYPLLWHE